MTTFTETLFARLDADMGRFFRSPSSEADAWRSIRNVEPVFALDNMERQRLVSRHTRNGFVPTYAEAMALEQEGREYVYAETMDGRYPEIDHV